MSVERANLVDCWRDGAQISGSGAPLSLLVAALASLLGLAPASSQDILGNVRSEMERLKSTGRGRHQLAQGRRAGASGGLLGMESCVYGYPLVITDVSFSTF